MGDKTVNSPDLLKGKDFEDFKVTYFQGAGFYIERSITEKEIVAR